MDRANSGDETHQLTLGLDVEAVVLPVSTRVMDHGCIAKPRIRSAACLSYGSSDNRPFRSFRPVRHVDVAVRALLCLAVAAATIRPYGRALVRDGDALDLGEDPLARLQAE
jgi:hypothetical protein